MADIFVSYASEDRETAADLVEVLKAQGWSVWWDRDIAPGTKWDESIQKGMNEARCMIVLWSRISVASRMVKDEANYAANHDALVPALIEECEIPYGYGMLQAANLTNWEGETDHPGLVQVLAATRKQLGRKTEAIRIPVTPRRRRRWQVPAALLAPLPIAALLGMLKPARFEIRAQVRASEVSFQLSRQGPVPTNLIPLSELGVARMAAAELPPARDTALGIMTHDRLLLRLPARRAITIQSMNVSVPMGRLALKPAMLAESTVVRLRVEGAGLYHVSLRHPRLDPVAIPLSGRVMVFSREHFFEPGEATLQPDSGDLELDLTTLDSSVELSAGLEVRGLDFSRADRFREGQLASDVAVSTIESATIEIKATHQAGPSVGEGEPLELAGPIGLIGNIKLEPSGISFNFDGTVRCLGVGTDAARCSYRPTWFAVVTAGHPAALAAGLGLYVAVAGAVMIFLRKKR